jgi:hypothetical protein
MSLFGRSPVEGYSYRQRAIGIGKSRRGTVPAVSERAVGGVAAVVRRLEGKAQTPVDGLTEGLVREPDPMAVGELVDGLGS